MTGRRYGEKRARTALLLLVATVRRRELGARRDVEDAPVPATTLTKHSWA